MAMPMWMALETPSRNLAENLSHSDVLALSCTSSGVAELEKIGLLERGRGGGGGISGRVLPRVVYHCFQVHGLLSRFLMSGKNLK